MSLLRIVIDVDHDIDPVVTDPQEIAEDMIGSYEADRRHGWDVPEAKFVSAEWIDGP